MRYNCETSHGPTLITAAVTAVGATVVVEWGPASERRATEYVFSAPPASTHDSIAEAVAAKLAVSHFNRTNKPIPQNFRFGVMEIAMNHQLQLMPLA